MILRQENVNKEVSDVCTAEVRLTFAQNPGVTYWDTETNTMVESEYPHFNLYGYNRDAEILVHFFHSHKLIPTWLDPAHF